MNTLQFLADSIRAAWRKPFRGQIYEYAGKLDLQGGYAVKGLIDIKTLRHLIEPLRAIRDLFVRLVSIIGAVQTTKSLIADICNAYWAEHDPGDLLWLLEDDPKAKEYADRALGLFCSIPEIRALLDGMERHDKTKTVIRLPRNKIVLCGLNPGNVQSLSWQRVIVDETWLHPGDGLLRHAMDRTKQYPSNKKIILIGQGGVEDDDHHVEHKETDQRALHYSCPACGAYQPFELTRQRPKGFKLRDGQPAGETYAGLSWDTNDQTKPNGRWNYEEVGKTAHHRCYYCDHRIEDTPEVRRALNDSYAYFPAHFAEDRKVQEGQRYKRTSQVPLVTAAGDILYDIYQPAQTERAAYPLPLFPEKVGFQWPGEASIRVSFRELAVKYLRAKTLAEELAYRLPLREYYQKDRGLHWSETVEAEFRVVVQEAYDPKADWDDEGLRTVIVDCQRDLKKFYYEVIGSSLDGQARELERGTVDTFDAIEQIQKAWKVKYHHVFLDCGYNMTKVLRECVKRGHVAQVKRGNKTIKVWRCWIGLKGSGREFFLHKRKTKAGTVLKEWKFYSERNFYNVNIGTKDRYPRAPWYEWSNLHVKDLLRDRRDADPSAPKFLFLPDDLPATDQNSFFQQMRSERREEIWTVQGKRSIWKLVKETRPNHRWDCWAMFVTVQGIAGIIAPDQLDESQAESN